MGKAKWRRAGEVRRQRLGRAGRRVSGVKTRVSGPVGHESKKIPISDGPTMFDYPGSTNHQK
jgi:hypothetical protein